MEQSSSFDHPGTGRHASRPAGAGSVLSRRQFLTAALLGGSSIWIPSRRTIATRPARAGRCDESIARVWEVALTVEALTITAYYRAITSEFWMRLDDEFQLFVRASLAADAAHARYIENTGARPLVAAYFFPTGVFGRDGFARFLATIEELKTTTIGVYLAAIRHFGAAGEPVLAAIAGQLLGVAATHRIIAREMAQNAPPPPNDLCFERATIGCVDEALGVLAPFLNGASGMAGPIARPSDAAVDAALAGADCVPFPPASVRDCPATVAEILAIAATAEALGITFYYEATRGALFGQLTEPQRWYFQAALDQERNHLEVLQSKGATPRVTEFFFPAGIFDDLPRFLALLDAIENAFIGAYLAAVPRLAALGEPVLAEIAGQIMSIEAEHRVLGRVVAGELPPNDRCIERAAYRCVHEAVDALAPFTRPGDQFSYRAVLPSTPAIDAAVDRFGCAEVPLASEPPFRSYLPYLRR